MKRVIFLILTLVAVMTAGAQVEVDQSVDSVQIMIGDQAKLTLSAAFKRGQSLQLPTFKEKKYIVPGLEVLDETQGDTVDLGDGNIKVSKSYVLTSFDENVYMIPSMNVKVNGKAYPTKSLALKVLTVPVDTVNADKFYPPKDVQDNPFSWAEWEMPLLLSVLFVVLLVVSIWLGVRLKRNKPVVTPIKVVKRIPPHEKAISGIEKLKAEKASVSEDQKAYYTQLTSILRKYMQERFGFDAMEMTSSEIIDRLRSEGNGAIDEVVNLFRTADLVKFAKHSVLINENDANLMNALAFINDTKTDEKEKICVVQDEDKAEKTARSNRVALKVAVVVLAVGALCALVGSIYIMYTLI